MDLKPMLQRVLLAVISLVLSLVAVEMCLRLAEHLRFTRVGNLQQQLEASRRASLERENTGGRFTLKGLVQPGSQPGIIFELKPSLHGRFKGGEVRINSWGFRGDEIEIAKPRAGYRIVGLGDSFMFGWGVDQKDTYLALVEEVLKVREGDRFQVLNLAVPGYNTAMEVDAFAARGLAFEPDLVVIHFYRNDLGLPYFMLRPEDYAAERGGLRIVALARRALGLPAPAQEAHRDLLAHAWVRDSPKRMDRVGSAYASMTGKEGYRQAMSRLGDLAREHSIPVVVILLEADGELTDLVREVVEKEGFHLLDPGRHFSDYLRSQGIDADRWAETFQLSSEDVHLNRLGHAVLADALVQFLEEQQLLAGDAM